MTEFENYERRIITTLPTKTTHNYPYLYLSLTCGPVPFKEIVLKLFCSRYSPNVLQSFKYSPLDPISIYRKKMEKIEKKSRVRK
jgi:hypothetical protein